MSESASKVIRGAVDRIIFERPASPTRPPYVVATLSLTATGMSSVTFAGKVAVREGEFVCLRGGYVAHPKYGRQFEVAELIYEAAVDPQGLAAWLAKNGKGIGPQKAAAIADRFADGWDDWLGRDRKAIADCARVPLSVVDDLAELWFDKAQKNLVVCRLKAWGLSDAQCDALYAKFKQSILSIIEKNPYDLVRLAHGYGFKKADEVALKMGTPRDHPGRVRAAVEYCLGQAARREGCTAAPRAEVVAAAAEELGDLPGGAAALVEAAMADLARAGDVPEVPPPGGAGPSLCALRRHYEDERGVADFFRLCAAPSPHGIDPLAVLEGLPGDPPLDEGQMAAVALAFSRKGCLITGGAGTGKTTIIRAIADAFGRHGFAPGSVLLCAPTGKAARRLEEVTGRRAYTIHRALGYDHLGRFHHHAGEPLTARVVIVDEVSMMGSDLCSSLFAAVGPKTSVVLVGDQNQLPPVSPGAVLRDTLGHSLLPAAVLEHCHRQAGALRRNAHAVLGGVVAPTEPAEGAKAGPWYVASRQDDYAAVMAYLERLYSEVLGGVLGYDPVADVQFLSPIHDGPIGVDAVNRLLQRLRQRSRGVEVPPSRTPQLMAGDKVMQTMNDYGLGLMNGTQGVVVSEKPFVIDFSDDRQDRRVVVPPACAGNVKLAYCVTPHKAQGSEFPCVVVVCHSKHSIMLNRNWLYTAVTRASRTCVIVGDARGIQTAAKTVRANRRQTLLPLLGESAY